MDDIEDDDYPNELETELRVLRLVTGEDLITECTELDSDENFGYILINPLKIMYFMNSNTGTISINFMRWFNSVVVDDQVFRIEAVNVLTYQFPSEKLANKYNEWVSSDEEKMMKRSENNPKMVTKSRKKKSVIDELQRMDSLEKKLQDLDVSEFVQKSLSNLKSPPKGPKRKPLRPKEPRQPEA